MATKLSKLKINEISLVDAGANQHADILIAKRKPKVCLDCGAPSGDAGTMSKDAGACATCGAPASKANAKAAFNAKAEMNKAPVHKVLSLGDACPMCAKPMTKGDRSNAYEQDMIVCAPCGISAPDGVTPSSAPAAMQSKLNGSGSIRPIEMVDGSGFIGKLKRALGFVSKAADPEDDAAKDFKEALSDNASQQAMWAVMSQLYDFDSALVQSIRSIIEDDTLADKGAAISASLDQFKGAVLALVPQLEAADAVEDTAEGESPSDVAKDAATGGKGADLIGKTVNSGDSTMTAIETPAVALTASDIQKMLDTGISKAMGEKQAVIDAQAATIAKLLDVNDDRDLDAAVAKLSHLPGDKVALRAVLKGMNSEQRAAMIPILAGASNAVAKSRTFAELGSDANGDASTGDTSPLAKAAKAEAVRIEKAVAAR